VLVPGSEPLPLLVLARVLIPVTVLVLGSAQAPPQVLALIQEPEMLPPVMCRKLLSSPALPVLALIQEPEMLPPVMCRELLSSPALP